MFKKGQSIINPAMGGKYALIRLACVILSAHYACFQQQKRENTGKERYLFY